jgi:hypothetical protein
MRRTERNIYAHTIYFGVLILGIYVVLSFLVNQVSWSDRRVVLHLNPTMARIGGQEYLMTRSFDLTVNYDLFVVGSSHAYRGYDPRFFEKKGLRLFNAGSSAQHPTVSHQLLTHMAQRCPKKPLIIVDVFDKILEMDGQESMGRMLLNCAAHPMALDMLQDEFNMTALNNYMARLFADPNHLEVEAKDYVLDGYCSRSSELAAAPDPVNYVFQGNQATIDELEGCLKWLASNGYRFVVVSHPMPQQGGFEAYHAPAAKVIDELAVAHGAYFLDFTELNEFSEHTRYFSDETHLNQMGVETFNSILLDSLHSLNLLGKDMIP